MASREEQIIKEIGYLRGELEIIQNAAKDAENKALIGKCFVFENSYGGGEKWNSYRRVNGVENGRLLTTSFQVCSLGWFDFKPNESVISVLGKEIPRDKFNRAFDNFYSALESRMENPFLKRKKKSQ